MAEPRDASLSEAVTIFLASLSPDQKQESQQELSRFVRWFGGDRPLSQLTAMEVGNYCGGIGSAVTDLARRLESVRTFLSWAWKQKMTRSNLAVHVRASKSKQGRVVRRPAAEVALAALTPEGYALLEAELQELKAERPRIADQLRLAAADKDFRENAPLEAAREHQGQTEARIRELEAILKGSSLVEEVVKPLKGVGIGSMVSLFDLSSGEELRYKLVSPSEADPARGRLSIASPIGRALLDQEVGTVIQVMAPAGKMEYRIDEIKG
jgi:transcription elongation factor GreA